MSQLFTNNASGTLSVQAEIVDTLITVQSNEGQLFPAPTGGDFFQCTLEDTAGNIEIVTCTGVSTDDLTVVRAQESTSAKVFPTGSRVELRPTADHSAFLQVYGGVMQAELDMDDNQLTDPLIQGGEIRGAPIRGTDGGTANEIIVPTAGGVVTIGAAEVWHADNDGTGSGLDADKLDNVEGAGYVKPADTYAHTGTITLDGDETETDFGTGAKVKDGVNTARPVGFNVMPPILEVSNYTLGLSRNGMLLHRTGTGDADYTCPNDANIPDGATWVVNNTGASGLFRIKGATGVSVLNLAGVFSTVTTVVAGNGFTLDIGAVVTIYKLNDTTYHIWGSGLTTSA